MAKAGKQDAIALLKDDHEKVREAHKQFEKMDHEDTATLAELAAIVCEELKAHTGIEEEIFYPAVRKVLDDDDLMNEALVEHASAKDLIAQLEGMKPADPMFAATFTVLFEYVEHHADEEEKEMFPKVRKTGLDLDALGARMMRRKERLMAMA